MSPLELTDNSLKSQEINPGSQAPQEVDLPLPRRFERFTLLARVARGGMGEVYLAAARGIEGAERPLIVKIIRPDHAQDRSFVARFLDEARIQAQLQHPGVAQILEATTDAEGKPYVVVEYVEGRNLGDVRTRSGQLGLRISWAEAVAIGTSLGDALAHVHERTDAEGRPLEIVHRDLSPQNVMVGYGGELKIIDFGTARGQNRRCQTISGIVFAKPGYVAPEVANNQPGGIPADLYAFGVMLWELLAGRRFLTGEATQHLTEVGAGRRPLVPIAKLIGAPAELDLILARLTAQRIEDRYESARKATQDLVKLLQRATSLADGERSVRARVADLMRRLYPAEPARSRGEFVKRLAQARSLEPKHPLPEASPEAPEATEPGMLSGTRYRLVREIGRGAMGIVHQAVHVDLSRTVALKLLSAETMSAAAQSRFRAEARAIAQLSHENLVKVFDFGMCRDGRLFYAMELLDGQTLAERLDREQRLTAASVIDFGIQACRALDAAHRAKVIHRDIKPANLFVTRDGTLKVLDFGLATSITAADAPPNAENPVALVGTPEYMAPEQARGESDARSDVYALGAVLYELCTGFLPHDADAPLAIIAEKQKRPERPSRRVEGLQLPRALENAILRALSPSPEDRPESAEQLAKELEAALHEPRRRSVIRRRLGAVAVGVTLVGCFAVLGSAFARSPRLSGLVREHASEGLQTVTGAWDRLAERRAALVSARQAPPGASPKVNDVRALPPIEATSVHEANAVQVEEANSKAPEVTPTVEATPKTNAEASEQKVAGLDADAETTDPSADDKAAEEADESSGSSDASSQGIKGAAASKVTEQLERARVLAEKGRELRALALLRSLARRHAKDPNVLAALTQALQKNRSWGEALKVARQRVSVDGSPQARLELARVERASGHRERAIALLNPLTQVAETQAAARELLRSLGGTERVALRQ
ncbi:MAG TPA: serine/threonine-protein kinase [Polyangiaceae bacterium]|nr:serine/threonine-protein kinase [Polyangiaceae bacterium]